MNFRVVEAESGRPIEGAVVKQPYPEPPQEYVTDAAGACRIAIPEPAPDQLGVLVEKPGFVPMRVMWEISWRSKSVPAEYTLLLERNSSIAGTVNDEEGHPIAGVTVFLSIWAEGANRDSRTRSHILDSTVTTDASGGWRFDGAPSDVSSVLYRLKHPDYVEEIRYSQAEGAAEPLRNGSIVWEMKKGVAIEGVVTGPEGQPIPDAEILPGDSRFCSGEKPVFHTNAEGKFSIRLTPGRQESLTMKAPGFAPALVQFGPQPGMMPLLISMEPGHTIRGRIVDAAGAPIPGALICADTWRRHRTLEWHTQTDEEGRFVWSDAPPDEVLFDFLKMGFRAVRRMSITASDEEQVIVLRKPMWIRGAVTDARTGKPLEAFRIIPGYVFRDTRIAWKRDAGADFRGGKYEWRFSGDTVQDTVSFLRVEARGYRSAVAQIQDSGEAATLDFALEPGAANAGRVLNPDGSPAADASIVIVFANPARLEGSDLIAGHGNMTLCTSEEGAFSFPSQEPPYTVAAANPLGCVIRSAEEFAAQPDLQLQAWGRLEITADGASPAGEPIPFQLHYPDLPRDARKMPWVFVQPQPKRLAQNRIVFENLPPGKVWVSRSRQPNHQNVNILIEPGRTTTLDFDRGVGDGGENVPGIVAVKVIDETGQSVEGATVESTSFSLKGRRGSHFRKTGSTSPTPERRTNGRGIAMVRNPMHFREEEVESISLRVRHPDYCTAQAEVPVAGEALPVVLKRGGTVMASGVFEVDGRTANRIYAEVRSPERGTEIDPDNWVAEENGVLANRQVHPGRHFIRLVSFSEEDGPSFSDVAEVNLVSGQVCNLRLELKAGMRVAGRLDESVPRPVENGSIQASVLSETAAGERPMQWHSWTEIQADGSFVFEILPPGSLELHAVCDGFVSANPAGEKPRPIGRLPQTFPKPDTGLVVEMEAATSVRVEARDEDGAPLTGVAVHLSPNILSASGASTIFGGPGMKTETILRMTSEERKKGFFHRGGTLVQYHGRTDEDGVVTIANLPAGKMHFSVHTTNSLQSMPDFREIELAPGEARTVKVKLLQNRFEA